MVGGQATRRRSATCKGGGCQRPGQVGEGGGHDSGPDQGRVGMRQRWVDGGRRYRSGQRRRQLRWETRGPNRLEDGCRKSYRSPLRLLLPI